MAESHSLPQVTSSEGTEDAHLTELSQRGMVEQRLWSSFPRPGEYFVRVKLVSRGRPSLSPPGFKHLVLSACRAAAVESD